MTTFESISVGRFDQKISRSTAISLTAQLESQLPQAQQLATRRLVPRPAHVLGTASSPAHRVRSCSQMPVQ
jgi:hypothetical protein